MKRTRHRSREISPEPSGSSSSSESDTEEDSDEESQCNKPRAKKVQHRSSAYAKKVSRKRGRSSSSESENEEYKSSSPSPKKKVRKDQWYFLEHKGPLFAPIYEPLPKNVKFRYNGKPMKLTLPTEEVACHYSRFIEHDYSKKKRFRDNFFEDWRKQMTDNERKKIKCLDKCDFTEINDYHKRKREEKKSMSQKEKQRLKEENEAITKRYGTCIMDGHEERIGNFRVEPPGIFIGRGNHPQMGRLKVRINPEDIIINCSKSSKIPKPPKSHKWKEIRHDNTVAWLACWEDTIKGGLKYVMLSHSSRLKGDKDYLKFEKARELHNYIDEIRENYKEDYNSKDLLIRERAVALYFIDKLSFRVGNEKGETEAETVGCCTLRKTDIKLFAKRNGKVNVVKFDFLGKDSIRYQNEVEVEKLVFKNLKDFLKTGGKDLFHELTTQHLNKYLSGIMNGLTAKVFRTYNASHLFQQELDDLTYEDDTDAEKILAYNRANRAVAILCNHKRAVPKSHENAMENLERKIDNKAAEIRKLEKELERMWDSTTKKYEDKEDKLDRAEDQLRNLELSRDDREEGKDIALGTSKLNYLDPRITVAWCDKYDVPIEKIYNKTQLAKFRWALDMADQWYRFD